MENQIVSVDQLTREDLQNLRELAARIKQNPDYYKRTAPLWNKTIIDYFVEASTRTRFSFEIAAKELGAVVISVGSDEACSIAKGETLEDTMRIFNGFADAVIMRHPEDNSAERAAAVLTVPFINAGSGKSEHPTQALLDVFTMQELKGELDGVSVGIMSDLKYGRTTHSLSKLLALYDGVHLYGLPIPGLEFPQEYIQYLESKGGKYTECNSIEDFPRDIDFIYQTRVQNERIPKKRGILKLRRDDFESKQTIIDQKLMTHFSKDTFVLHPLPRRGEISTNFDGDPRAKYFEQAYNGVHVRKAVLLTVLDKDI